MAASSTVVFALRYAEGIVIGADSQASDQHAKVRWPVEKLSQVGSWPLVVGFSGSLGVANRARADIESFGWQSTTFNTLGRVQRAIELKVKPHYNDIRESVNPSSPFNYVFGLKGLWGIAACYTKDVPTILELEASGDTCTHRNFHAIGSGAQTAYAIWRTIGGRLLSELDEGRALHVTLRILQTCVDVEMSGVSAPFSIFVVSSKGVRAISNNELNALDQAVHEWQKRELSVLLDRQLD